MQLQSSLLLLSAGSATARLLDFNAEQGARRLPVDACAIVGEEGNAFVTYSETINGLPANTFTSNCNCQQLGYDFGWKMEGCADRPTGIQFDALEVTGQGLTCDPYQVGSFSLDCSEENEPEHATITPSTNTAVIMKGANGGVIYNVAAGETVTVDVGQAKAISHIEFCFKCSDEIVTQTVRVPEDTFECPEGEMAVVDHDAAQTISAEIPVTVDIVNDQSHFDLIIKENHPPYTGPGETLVIDAFCVDYSRGIWGAEFSMDVFSALDPEIITLYGEGHQTSSAVDHPEYLPNLGWLMNNIKVGDPYDDGEGCAGTIDWNEYQVALWYVIDGLEVGDSVYDYYNGGNRQDCISQGLAAMAIAQGTGWQPDCMRPEEYIPILFIVDDGTTIKNQVLMGLVKLLSIEGMCKCVPAPTTTTLAPPTTTTTEAPPTTTTTEAPPTTTTTEAPPATTTTEAPPATTTTEAPPATTTTEAPPATTTTTPDDVMTTTSPPGTKGDPHFKTHGGEMYDFHGGCDLVLVDNPDFMDGLGMTVHIRTKIETWWSYVESAVIRIGDQTVEISGGGQDNWLYLDGQPVESLETNKWALTKLAGLPFRYKHDGKNGEAHIYFDRSHMEKIELRTFNEFVKVEISHGSQYYAGSHGMLGSFPEGKRVGRDGKTVIEDVNAFGLEWQVRPEEPKLFHNYDAEWVVPAGQKCAMPIETAEKTKLRQRRLANGMDMKEAEKACAHLAAEDQKACIFDVIATQDVSMAAVW